MVIQVGPDPVCLVILGKGDIGPETDTRGEDDVKTQEPRRQRVGATPQPVQEHRGCCHHQQVGEEPGGDPLRFHPEGSVSRSECPASQLSGALPSVDWRAQNAPGISTAAWLGEACSSAAGLDLLKGEAAHRLRGHPANRDAHPGRWGTSPAECPLAHGQG